ncbi:MAG: DUF4403 family protein [Flavobacteriaceae bacterium]|jgi:hypothetical protein|nr:DUF4403 family protein [Flavobacteriaceae bacterium]
MKIFLGVLIIVLLLIFISGCATSQKLNTLKPEPEDVFPAKYEAETSFVNLPVSIKLKDIAYQTNKSLNGLIYNDSILEDDNLKLQVWKKAPIEILDEQGKIKTVLPLKIKAHYRYGFEKLGIKLYDTKEFNMDGTAILISHVGLTNWQLRTSTAIHSLEWNESPSVVISGKNFPITYLINPAIRLFKSKIEKSIDEAIGKSMNFKPQVLDALDKLSIPFQISDAFESWLRLVPIEVYATDARLKDETIEMEMGLKCIMETHIGHEPQKKFDRDNVILKPVKEMPNRVKANIVAVSTYNNASNIITKNFHGQEFGEGNKKVKVQKVNLWYKNEKIIIALDLVGSVNGTIYLTGFPQYDEETSEVYFDQLDYVLNTKNVLMKTANWMAQGYVLRKLRESCRYSIKSDMEEGENQIKKFLSNYSPVKGVFINGNIESFEFQKMALTNKAIIAYLKATGKIQIKIDGME